jgi:hypothetical protein
MTFKSKKKKFRSRLLKIQKNQAQAKTRTEICRQNLKGYTDINLTDTYTEPTPNFIY